MIKIPVRYTALIGSVFMLFLGSSCEVAQDGIDASTDAKALFLTTTETQISYLGTRTSLNAQKVKTHGSMVASVEEQDWICSDVENSTRGTVSGNEITWEDSPSLGVYITDATSSANTLVERNLAINPLKHTFFPVYSGSGNGTTINNVSFFWDKSWTGKSTMPTNVNFYGYYPRPVNGSSLNYSKTSIVLLEDATGQNGGEWNKLHYAFIDQTDANMSWHDVMYSIPEKEDVRYGNQNKTKNDNVQLHFVHAFSLLDIEIDKGTYKGDCNISSLVLSGTQVFTEGTLDIQEGEIIPSRGDGSQSVEIKRVFETQKITAESPFHKTMIVQPTQDGDSPDEEGRLVITCCIDGVNYSCDFPTLKLKPGKKYKLRLTLTPTGIVLFKIWDGASVYIDGVEYLPKDSETEITSKANTFKVLPADGYRVVDVLKNGVSIYKPNDVKSDGSYEYELDSNVDNNTNYNVVACPSTWYSTDGLQLHFDGFQNKYNNSRKDDKPQLTNIGTWYDLSGHNNDGTLRSFTNNSGWDGKGLVFDGLDDVVYFSGKINKSYTMEMYVCVDPTQRGSYPRFTAEGNKYPSFYITGTGQSYDGTLKSTSYSRGIQFYDKHNTGPGISMVTDGKTIVQLDFVYDSDDGTITWYVNGDNKGQRNKEDKLAPVDPESIDIASIGNRYVDNSRALNGTFYSFMIYRRAITKEEVKHNYDVNVVRYTKSK